MKAMKMCYWLLIPEDLYPGRFSHFINKADMSPQKWKVLNIFKGAFWYCVALVTGLLMSNLH